MSEISKAFTSRPFQKKGALFAMKYRHTLIADEPGLGKSLQAIAAIVGDKKYGSILIIAPKTACLVTWPAELTRWLSDIAPDDVVRTIGGKDKLRRNRTAQRVLKWDIAHDAQLDKQQRQWVIVSPNYVRFDLATDKHGNFIYDSDGDKIILPVREAIPALLAVDWSAIIVDEAHQTLAGAHGDIKKQSAQSRGIRLLSLRDNGLRIALTGTPFRGKHENLWGILNWLEPNRYTSYWGWCNRHFNMTPGAFGGTVVGPIKSEKKLYQEVSRLMIRRTKSEVAKDLPPKMYGGTPLFKNGPIAVWLPMEGDQRQAYESMARAAMVELEGGQLMANGILAEIVRLKQFANSYGYIDVKDAFRPRLPSNKFEWLLEFLRERGIDGPEPTGNRIIVASQFTKHIDMFAQELRERHKIPCFTLTGKTSDKERVIIQRQFQSGKTDDGLPSPEIFMLNTRAGGVSLTLDSADEIVIFDSTFNEEDQEQVEDRAHRISRIHNVTVWRLASQHSIDESIARNTHNTNVSIRKILDGERGVEWAKKLFKEAL